MRVKALVLAGLAVCFLVGSNELSAQSGTLSGTVVDLETGATLASAQVEILSSGEGAALTSANGQFSFSVSPGTYSVVVTALGYRPHREDGVRVNSGGSMSLEIRMTSQALELNPLVVTASRTTETSASAPATVIVIGETDVAERPTVTPVDHLRAVPGVDVMQQGVQSTNVVIRGFNNVFSGSLHTLVDDRIAGVPSLRVNLMHFIPSQDEDLERIEVVLGPGSALYGPNTSNGVIHLITKSPLESQGSTVTLGGGQQNVFEGGFRTARKLSDNFGFKVSAKKVQGDDWNFVDPIEAAARASALSNKAAFIAERIASGASTTDANSAYTNVGNRNLAFNRESVDARADWDVGENTRLMFNYGLTSASGVELTGLGGGQTEDWKYQFYQARIRSNRMFAQAYLNTSDAGPNSFLLRNGTPLVDKSQLWVTQLRNSTSFFEGKQDFTYGMDYTNTNPVTEGTVNGAFEDDDDIQELGIYLQSKTAITDRLDLIVAGRRDTHSRLDKNTFSPRAALVFEPAPNHSFRATYNRAFSTPSSLNMFLEISGGAAPAPLGGLGYRIRAQGNGNGYVYQNADGSLKGMRSPFNPAATGGASQLLPVQQSTLYAMGVGVMQAQGAVDAATAGLLNSFAADAGAIGINLLNTNNMKVSPLVAGLVPSTPKLEISTNTTYEMGYQGLVNDKVLFAVDGWYSQRKNFVSPLMATTPMIMLDGATMVAFLQPRLSAVYQAQGMDAATAGATALVAATKIADGGDGMGGIPGLAEVPLAVVSTQDINADGAELMATYMNAGDLNVWGADFSMKAFLNDEWTLSSTASFVSDDYFTLAEMTNAVSPIYLNAPKSKASLALGYRGVRSGHNLEMRVRVANGFPANSAGFVGTKCVTGGNGGLGEEECVKGHALMDAVWGYKVPGTAATLQLTANNLLGTKYRSFVGVPEMGRFVMARVKYAF
jgi:outer membrane receptor for ferrienterochelin and colicins